MVARKDEPSEFPSPTELGGTYPPMRSRKSQLQKRIAWTNATAPRPATTPMSTPRIAHFLRYPA